MDRQPTGASRPAVTGDDPGPRPDPDTRSAARWPVLLFAGASFLTAALLFVVQPMVGRMVLPAFGGSPQVWTTSMLFFQVALLAGYGYTHLTTNRLGPRHQPRLHVLIALLPILLLPIVVDVVPSGRGGLAPSFELLGALVVGVAAPFLLIATSGPLVQRWLSWTDHPSGRDPYFLYAAGNLGSATGLLAYPFVLEPLLTLRQQSWLWAGGYVLAVVLLAGCAWQVRQPEAPSPDLDPPTTTTPSARGQATAWSWGREGRWVLLAFVPSSVMLAATSHLTTDVAAVPLLWVIPLGVYLLTFSVAFSRVGQRTMRVATIVAGPVVLGAITLVPATFGVQVAVVVQVLFVAVAGAVAHGQLAGSRPHTSQLTRFYLMVATGGALGGVVNGLIAPAVFPTVLEHPLIAAATFALVVRWREVVPTRLRGGPAVHWLAGLVLATVPIALVTLVADGRLPGGTPQRIAVVAGLLLPLALPLARVVIVAVALATAGMLGPFVSLHQAAHTDRTFYGVHQVRIDDQLVRLHHGTTLHGTQDISSPDRRRVALTYYHPQGPFGDLYEHQGWRGHLGVLGLGTGGIATYGIPGQTIVFHEIDPAVVDIAQRWFTFLEDSPADVEVVLGDGRLTIDEAPRRYALLALDAFTSDAIPVHLLTVEAFERYLDAITDDGVIAAHITNRHLDLGPVMAGLAEAHDLHALERSDRGGTDRLHTRWVAFARDADTLAGLEEVGWTPLEDDPVVWTDQRSDLWSVTSW